MALFPLFPSADNGPVVSHRKRRSQVAQRARLLLEVWGEPGAPVPTPDFKALICVYDGAAS